MRGGEDKGEKVEKRRCERGRASSEPQSPPLASCFVLQCGEDANGTYAHRPAWSERYEAACCALRGTDKHGRRKRPVPIAAHVPARNKAKVNLRRVCRREQKVGVWIDP